MKGYPLVKKMHPFLSEQAQKTCFITLRFRTGDRNFHSVPRIFFKIRIKLDNIRVYSDCDVV